MAVQLNPSKIPIWKSQDDLQLGLTGEAQKLQGISNAQERLIQLLFQGVAEDQLELIGDSVGLSDHETNELVERLRPSLLEKGRPVEQVSSFDVRFAEIIRIGFDTNQLPESILAQRADVVIQIDHLDRTGLLLLRALVEAGFRKFETADFDSVKREDSGELGYPNSFLGISRLTAARQVIQDKVQEVTLNHLTRIKGRRFVLMSAMHVLMPTRYQELGHPHLAIEYGVDRLKISPLVTPGKTPCFKCRALWQAEQETDWASTSIQLVSRKDFLDDASALLLAVAIASRTICSYLNDNSNFGGFEVDLKTRAVANYHWQFHPACSCRKN